MNPERWQQIDQVLEAALEHPPAERVAFLAEVCLGDETLRREVESLLRSDGAVENFIEQPAVVAAAEMLAKNQAQSLIGQRLGHYQILTQLGAGGMGEVYLAEDTKLSRKVALKLLPVAFTLNASRVRRFVQEAKAASALNHPNIITIHESGEAPTAAGAAHFIATEFIDGTTLRARLAGERLSLNVALDIALQIAAALSAAHEVGIVHRDIKPENVMVRRDCLVKVLDFGLAKLAEQNFAAVDPKAPTNTKENTDPGTVMGTASYMSPEQARGQEVDARSDIFSLGVVLYEMLAGQAPFTGVNTLEVIGEILKTEPAPLKKHTPDMPAELQRIVHKALRKDREERYQHIKDLLLDLKDLKQELEFEAKLKGAQPFGVPTTGGDVQTRETPLVGGATNAQSATAPKEIAAPRTTSSAEIILGELKRHKRGVFTALAALVLAVVGLAFGLNKLLRSDSAKPSAPFQAMRLTRLTSHGRAMVSTISPDGKYVVYAQREEGRESLWMAQVAVSSNVQIVPSAEVNYRGLTFSRDGNFIYYVQSDQDNLRGALYQMPVLGGNARKVLVNIQGAVTFSPNGKRLAFVRGDRFQPEEALMVANADGTGEQKLTTRKSPINFSSPEIDWSPDGKVIAFGQADEAGGSYRSVVGVRVSDGKEQPITSHRWEGNGLDSVVWLTDGSGVLAAAMEQAGGLPQLWFLAWPGNEARRLTNDLSAYAHFSLTSDSRTLAAVRSERIVNLWVAPDGDTSRARQITTGIVRDDGIRGLTWTPDGKILYYSMAGGNQNIWIMEADGTGNKQLSSSARRNRDAAISPDGRYIVWESNRTGNSNIWRINRDGGELKQLTNGEGEFYPQVSPDGRWVVYSSRPTTLRKVAIDGGAPVELSDRRSSPPIISPDGKLIAFVLQEETSRKPRIAVIPFEGGAPTYVLEAEIDVTRIPYIRWTPDGRAVAFINTTNGVSNIWAHPLDGGPPKQLTDFKDQTIVNFAWSRDGKQLVLSRRVINSDVVLITDFKQR